MSRTPRSFQPGVVYHLISRFIDHEWFITHDRERACYLELLGASLARTDWRCLSYAVMSSHIHLATVAGQEPLDRWIRRVHGPFAEIVNQSIGRIGSLFVRGPKAIETPPDRVASLIAYVHNNPVRAGVARNATQTDWTSHRAFLGLDDQPKWLCVEEALSRAGFGSAEEFDVWTSLNPNDPTRDERGCAIREDTAVPEPEATAECRSVAPDAVLEVVAEVAKTSVASLRSRRRDRVHSQARRAAVECADALGISGLAMARALGISQQRASAILLGGTRKSQTCGLVATVMERFAASSFAASS
jgi:REP-associated tyrosine transposase